MRLIEMRLFQYLRCAPEMLNPNSSVPLGVFKAWGCESISGSARIPHSNSLLDPDLGGKNLRSKKLQESCQ